ncbi:MAG: TonB-dependent receptor [Bacteroidota bacterium]
MRSFLFLSTFILGVQLGFGQSDKIRYEAWLDSMTNDQYIGIVMELDQVMVTDSAHLAHINSPKMQMNMQCTDQLMHCMPGVNMIRRGNFANEPMLRGLTSERYVMSVDGMRIYGACTDKMDPASSYIEPINLNNLDISFGSQSNMMGCGTGGGINFGLKKPVFNTTDPFRVSLLSNFSSVAKGFDQAMDINYSRDKWAFRISGVHRKSHNYMDGNGDEVRYSQFEKMNYAASVNYKVNDGSMIAFDFVGDDANDVGYPSLPMDVGFAKAKMFGLSYLTDKLWIIREPEVKVYYNYINHMMDDTKRDSVAMHMDMPGNTRTTGGFVRGFLQQTSKSSMELKVDHHSVFWHAEMTMYPNETNQQPMFMLTWPDVHRSVSGIELKHTYKLMPDHRIANSARIEHINSYISSEFGDRQLSIFDKSGDVPRNDVLLNLSSQYSLDFGDHAIARVLLAYGERVPTVSEQFGFYLFNQVDGYDYLGDPDLKKERNLHFELGHKISKPRFNIESAAFAYLFNDYIYGIYDPSLSNMTIGARGVKWYSNTGKAMMLGGEFTLRNQLLKDLTSELSTKYVYGEDFENEPLPQVPPLKLSYSLNQALKGWNIQPAVDWSMAQNRISDKFNERATNSYLLTNLGISKSVVMGIGSLRVGLNFVNIFNVAYREHFDVGSILRPGRSIDLRVSWKSF